MDNVTGGNVLATELVNAAYPKPLRRFISPEEVAQAAVSGIQNACAAHYGVEPMDSGVNATRHIRSIDGLGHWQTQENSSIGE